MPFGMINRFAGDHLSGLQNSLAKGYGAIDNQFGGILPGAAKPNVSDLVKSVAIESLPGSQPSPLDKQNKIVNKGFNAANDLSKGDVVGATARSHGGTSAGKIRERVAEYGGRKLIRGAAAGAAGTSSCGRCATSRRPACSRSRASGSPSSARRSSRSSPRRS